MAITDTIADLFTRIRNANHARHKEVDVPSSNLKLEVVKLLKEEGYIKDYEFTKDNKQGIIRIQLKYDSSKKGVISGIKRVSRPGLRKYVKKDKVAKVLNGLGLSILSTSKGILTDKKAREMGVGGELLCIVY
ncbi:MAG: 30S ribosomal protein S8 [Deltaproteobacteria bacterium RIFCSPLOWO2_02_44_9]|nr:MAG: 30S ribosomal protein S8 [Deltaproteobacteria bacterium RIFCSPLOWO2_02_44_9]